MNDSITPGSPLPCPFDFKSGKIKWNNFFYVPGNVIGCDKYDLTEDLILVQYDWLLSLDVGWYHTITGTDRYAVHVIKAGNWDAPIFHRPARTFAELKVAVEESVAFVEEKIRQLNLDNPKNHIGQ